MYIYARNNSEKEAMTLKENEKDVYVSIWREKQEGRNVVIIL